VGLTNQQDKNMECIICNKEISKPRKKFCSNTCKQKDNLQRTKQMNPNSSFTQLKGYYKRKLEAIDFLGGCCSKCGYNKNMSALHFHHEDPNKKLFSLDIRSFSNRSKELLNEEILKCSLLCANCHAETHHPEYTIENARSFVKLFPVKLDNEILNKN
jgi:hypothetical protein